MGKNPATATSTADLDSHATEAGPAAASTPRAASTSHAADAASSPAPYLQVRDLCKHYGEGEARATVLHDVTTTVNKGEICVLLGPSGSGKSTFLNLVGGLEAADSGSTNVGGTELTSLTSKQLGEYRRDKLGFVFQFYNLVPDLTIRENIEVTAHLSANPPAHRRPAALAWALRASREVPPPGFGRPATALRHRPRAGEESRAFAVRRAHRRAGLPDVEGDSRVDGEREPRLRVHRGHRHAQRRDQAHGAPCAAPARR